MNTKHSLITDWTRSRGIVVTLCFSTCTIRDFLVRDYYSDCQLQHQSLRYACLQGSKLNTYAFLLHLKLNSRYDLNCILTIGPMQVFVYLWDCRLTNAVVVLCKAFSVLIEKHDVTTPPLDLF